MGFGKEAGREAAAAAPSPKNQINLTDEGSETHAAEIAANGPLDGLPKMDRGLMPQHRLHAEKKRVWSTKIAYVERGRIANERPH